MDFLAASDEVLPDVNMDQVINEMPEIENSTMQKSKSQTKLPPTQDNSTEQITYCGDGEQITNCGDGVAVLISNLEPIVTTSNSKHISISSEMKNKGIQEFVRILRPHLPRKSKSKAYKLLQNIAKGIIIETPIQRRIYKKKPKKRTLRKTRVRNTKSKLFGDVRKNARSVRKNARSVYSSSDSCPSDVSCPRCGYSCCKISKY